MQVHRHVSCNHLPLFELQEVLSDKIQPCTGAESIDGDFARDGERRGAFNDLAASRNGASCKEGKAAA